MNDRKLRLKFALIVLLFAVAGLAAVYQLVYPLSLTDGIGYFLQIPPIFWAFVVLALAALFRIATLTKSSVVTLGSIVGISLVLNFHYFLTYGVTGRDMSGEIERFFFTIDKTHLGFDLYSYFQWPVHFLIVQQTERIASIDLISLIWVGYLAYYVLFACATGVFTYSYTDNNTFSWVAASIFYVAFTRQWLNSQFVPQFIALILLLFLFSTHRSDDERLRLLRVVLYLILLLAHPFFFAFYLLYVLILPVVRAAIDTIQEEGTTSRPLCYQLFEVVRCAHRALITLQFNLRRQLDITWVSYVSFLTISYLLFLSFRFVVFKQRLFVLLAGPETGSSSTKIPARVMEIIFGTSQYGGGGTGTTIETVLLYDLTSEMIKSITLYGTIGVLLSLLAISAVALFLTPASRVSRPSIGIVISGTVYYIMGFVLPIIGTRAFQVFLLPLGLFLDGIREYQKYLYVVVLLLLVVSPIIVANFMINYSLTAGGNTHDYHADEAGRFLLMYSDLERDGAVTYPNAGYPPDITKTGEDLSLTTVEAIIGAGANSSGTIVYGERQEYQAAHFNHRCNFSPDRRNTIYDNRIRVLMDSIISEPLKCVEKQTNVSSLG